MNRSAKISAGREFEAVNIAAVARVWHSRTFPRCQPVDLPWNKYFPSRVFVRWLVVFNETKKKVLFIWN